jgi:hypothetical protein
MTHEHNSNDEATRKRIAEIRRSQRMLQPDIASPRVAEDLRILDLELHELLGDNAETDLEPEASNWSPLATEMHANLDSLRRQ